jgi:adenosylcobinamide kinase/adenosylcobinamide-phosphate guanylyltransferase
VDLTLLGTGAPGGLPHPGCPCAACAAAVGRRARAATSLLVDGTLLLDLTPGPALAAARAGRSLHRVRQVLLTHPHDGPAVEQPPDLPAAVRVPDGQELVLISGHRVLAVALDAPGTGYLVTGPDGERLLYLPPGGAPAGGAPGGPYETVVMDVLGRPDALARLRGSGAVTAGTDVVAAHLGHGVPPGAELHRRLAAAGARTVPDGTTFVAGAYQEVPALPRRTLVLGGARSGTAVEAGRRLASLPGVVRVATGGDGPDDRDGQWVAPHRERWPATWRTRETCDLVPLLEADGPPLLVDSLPRWLSHVLDTADAREPGRRPEAVAREVDGRVAGLAAAVRRTRRTVVLVSDEAGSGVRPATAADRRFRDELGRANAAVAAECDHVLLMVAGLAHSLRP